MPPMTIQCAKKVRFLFNARTFVFILDQTRGKAGFYIWRGVVIKFAVTRRIYNQLLKHFF